MRKAFPELGYSDAWLNKTDWFVKLPNGSEIWFGGLDDGERMDKVLGKEYVTIYANECSQLKWAGIQTLLTRLAQRVMQVVTMPDKSVVETPMRLRFYYDENPPTKAHWSFKVFKQKVDPETLEPLKNPDNWACFQINPHDNAENLAAEYLDTLDALTGRYHRRFVAGEFGEATPNALFDEAIIDTWRVTDSEQLPDMVRIVVAADPSGRDDEDDPDNTRADAIGIVVAGLGTDGRGYVLEDLTVEAGPATWGRVVVDAYLRHKADKAIGERNFGGGMVRTVIQAACANYGSPHPRVNFGLVTASRGKVQRAEPFSALYAEGKIRHVGYLAKLEDEICAFSTHGYTGPRSPNRADAVFWALAELFPAMVAPPRPQREKRETHAYGGAGSWLGS
jgi:hypothetical protein